MTLPIDQDLSNLDNDLKKRWEDIQLREEHLKSLKEEVLKKLEILLKTKGPEVALAYAMQHVLFSLDDNGSVLGNQDDQIAILGDNLKISGDINKAFSDMQSYMNKALQSKSPDDIKNYGKMLDEMIKRFSDTDPEHSLGIDDSTKQTVLDNLVETRKLFNLSDDSEIDPTTGKAWSDETQGAPLDPNDSKKIQSFYDLAQDAKSQGDTHGAADVLKTITNNDNTNKTAMGSVSQAVNSNLSHAMNLMKETLGVLDNLLHSVYQIMNNAVTSQKGAG